MSSSQWIENLKSYRDAIIFVELASLFHDLGKCSSKFTRKHLKDSSVDYDHTKVIEKDKHLINNAGLQNFFEKNLMEVFPNSLPNYIVQKWELDKISIKEVIERHHEGSTPEKKLIAFIQIADRKDSADDRNMPLAKQEKETYVSSVFGIEKELDENNLDDVRKNFYSELFKIRESYKSHLNSQRQRKEVYDAFDKLKCALAETRRAANDVSLMDHSYAATSIMKALLTWDVLEDFSVNWKKLLPTYNHWNVKLSILGIGWDAYRLYEEAQSLSGVAGREILVDKVKGCLRDFLEYEVPIGNVIYEDQNSICFLVPENTPKIFDDLREQIINKVDTLTDGSIIPVVELSEANPYPNKVITKTIERLRERTATPLSENIVPSWKKRWDEVRYAEICVQCGKRPRRAKGEDICEFCLDMMREGISEVIRGSTVESGVYKETVWIDEIADEDGNVALIYGLIPLEKWLDGTLLNTMYIKTIYDIKKENSEELEKKLEDETKVLEFFEKYEGLSRAIKRFQGSLDENNIEDAEKIFRPFLSEDLRKNLDRRSKRRKRELLNNLYKGIYLRAGTKTPARVLEVMMTKSPSPSRIRKIWMETQNFFKELSTLTPSYILPSIGDYCLRLKFKPKYLNRNDERLLKSLKPRILEVEKFVFETKLPKSDLYWDGNFVYTTIRLEHYSIGEGLRERQSYIRSLVEKGASSGKPFVLLKIMKKEISIGIESYEFERYIPTRTILVSPNLFAVLLPANLAFDLLYMKYTAKYEELFSKVQNRLSLNLGIVFFKRKFPLYVALDVLHRFTGYFSKRSSEPKTFNIIRTDTDKLLLEDTDEDKVKIAKDDPWLLKYEWKVDDRLGNDAVDLYHPNFMINSDLDDIKGKNTYFRANIENSEILLNFKDLTPKTPIKSYPRFFDFHFLRSSGERFNIVSSIGKRMHPVLDIYGLRPYLIQDLKKLVELKSIIDPKKGKLTMSQVKKLEHICVTKIEEWFKGGPRLVKNPVDDEIYRSFVETSVKNVCRGSLIPEEESKLVQAILSGMFFDAVELFITLKSHTFMGMGQSG